MSRKRKPLSQIPTNTSKRINTNNAGDDNFADVDNGLDSGTILRMTLKNFMCHSLLEVEFDTNVNFVIGRNGSGKSAILTALIVGLGAKAAATNRGKSLKGFIKAGRNSAQIQIVLKNSGTTTYKQPLYGNTITVERTLCLSGSSSYKIKDSLGAVVTTKAKEVQNIMLYLNIQVDNPICILTQDMARNFLCSSDPKCMYTFFNKATRLELLQEEHRLAIIKRKEALNVFKEKQKLEEDLKKELKEINDKLVCYNNIEKMNGDLQDLEAELMWAKVVSAEKILEKHGRLVEKAKKELETLTSKFRDEKLHSDSIIEKANEIKRQMIEVVTARKATDEILKEHKAGTNQLAGKLAIKKRDNTRFLNEIEAKKREKKEIQYEVENFTTKMSEFEQKKLSNAREVAKLQEDQQKLTAKTDTLQNESFQITSDTKRMEDISRNTLLELESVKSKYNRTVDSINALKQQTNNPLVVYGRDMVALVEALKRNESKFSEPPRGPLGSYITVKDKKWRVAVEGFIGRHMLHSFCVNNQKDCDLLFQIIGQVWRSANKPTVITSKFFHQVHNVSDNMVRQIDGCVSIFEAITVSDPVVMNCLIDQNSIEGILLIPEINQAIKMMETAANVPRNCYQAVTTKGDQFYPDPNYKMYSSRYHEARYLQVDISQVLRQYEELRQGFEVSKNELQRNHDEIKHKIVQKKARSKDIISQLETCKLVRGKINQKISEKESNEELETGSVQQLEMDLKEIEQHIIQRSTQIQDVVADIKTLESQILEKEDEEEELRNTLRNHTSRFNAIENEFRELQSKRELIDQSRGYDKNRVLEGKKHLEEYTVVFNELRDSAEKLNREAQNICARMDEIRSTETLAKIIVKVRTRIDASSMVNEDIHSVRSRFQMKSQMLNDTEELLVCLNSNLDDLSDALIKRKKHYMSTRDYIKTYAQSVFHQFLKLRQFEGSIEIDYDNKTLNLVVYPQQGLQGPTTSSNLSGGERSFSTVAFLFTLWQTVPFPFYLLDEFDVFMDKVNRTKVMEILIHHAKGRKKSQFIFLTPQDSSFVLDKNVSLHRLEDPVRRVQSQ